MRILIEIRGGVFVGATVEDMGVPVSIILCDRDDLAEGQPFDKEGMDPDAVVDTEAFNDILDCLAEGGG